MAVEENVVVTEIVRVKDCKGYLLLTIENPPSDTDKSEYVVRVGVRKAASEKDRKKLLGEAQVVMKMVQDRLRSAGGEVSAQDLVNAKFKVVEGAPDA